MLGDKLSAGMAILAEEDLTRMEGKGEDAED
jgi:hypothetical protein